MFGTNYISFVPFHLFAYGTLLGTELFQVCKKRSEQFDHLQSPVVDNFVAVIWNIIVATSS